VIVDEIHAVAGTKRGVHLALSLERLEELTGGGLQRIGLSATQRPLDEAARFLGGFEDVAVEDGAHEVETVDEGLAAILGEEVGDDGGLDAKRGGSRGAVSAV